MSELIEIIAVAFSVLLTALVTPAGARIVGAPEIDDRPECSLKRDRASSLWTAEPDGEKEKKEGRPLTVHCAYPLRPMQPG